MGRRNRHPEWPGPPPPKRLKALQSAAAALTGARRNVAAFGLCRPLERGYQRGYRVRGVRGGRVRGPDLTPMSLRDLRRLISHEARRPKTRGDCVNGLRPCPWVGCRHHLAIETTPAASLTTPHESDVLVLAHDVGRGAASDWTTAAVDRLAAMHETCALDVVDQARAAGETLSVRALAPLVGPHFSKIATCEQAALGKLRSAAATDPELDAELRGLLQALAAASDRPRERVLPEEPSNVDSGKIRERCNAFLESRNDPALRLGRHDGPRPAVRSDAYDQPAQKNAPHGNATGRGEIETSSEGGSRHDYSSNHN